MIGKAIHKAFAIAKTRNWEKIFVAVDIHDTAVVSNYSGNRIPTMFYPNAKEVLQYLSERPDVTLIMYTSSHPHEMLKYKGFFEENGVYFKFINENPDCPSTGYGCYDKKFYFNVLIEDKAGFDAEVGWEEVRKEFEKYAILNPTGKLVVEVPERL
jgi:hypothetical protein